MPESSTTLLATEVDGGIRSTIRSHILEPARALWALASHILCWGAVSPPVISQTTGPISKIQTSFDSPVRALSKPGQKFDIDVTDDVTGQVKVRMFDFLGLVTSASTISMLSANKASESAWIVSLTFVSIISCTLRVGSGSGLSGPFSEVAVKVPMEYWLPFGLVLLFQILCIRASPFRISYFAL